MRKRQMRTTLASHNLDPFEYTGNIRVDFSWTMKHTDLTDARKTAMQQNSAGVAFGMILAEWLLDLAKIPYPELLLALASIIAGCISIATSISIWSSQCKYTATLKTPGKLTINFTENRITICDSNNGHKINFFEQGMPMEVRVATNAICVCGTPYKPLLMALYKEEKPRPHPLEKCTEFCMTIFLPQDQLHSLRTRLEE